MKIKILIFLKLTICCYFSYAQNLKNNVEFGILGNLGFANVGYTRSVISTNNFLINLGPKIGYVPGSNDDENTNQTNNSSVPSFMHLNLISEGLWKFSPSNNIGVGISYSKILVVSDKHDVRPKSNYDRILGEISYAHILGWSNSEKSTTWIKIYFTPIIYDNDANDVQNIPVRLSFIYNL